MKTLWEFSLTLHSYYISNVKHLKKEIPKQTKTPQKSVSV